MLPPLRCRKHLTLLVVNEQDEECGAQHDARIRLGRQGADGYAGHANVAVGSCA